MKKLSLIALILVLPVAVLAAWSRSNSPTDVARNLVHALEQHDQRQMNDLVCTDALAGVSLAGMDAPISFSNTTYSEQDTTDHTATVIVSSDVGVDGNSSPTRITWRVTLEKHGRNWCVNGLARAGF